MYSAATVQGHLPPRRSPATSALLAAVAAIGCSSTEPGPEGPDPARAFEVREHEVTYADAPFDLEVVAQFRTTEQLPDLDVRSLAITPDKVFAGTASGLFSLSRTEERFRAVGLDGRLGPVADLFLSGDRLLVARPDRIHVVDLSAALATETRAVDAPFEVVGAVAELGGRLFAGTDRGLLEVGAAGSSSVAAARGFPVRDLAVLGAVLFIATDRGVHRLDTAGGAALAPIGTAEGLPDADVRALTALADGSAVRVATAGGLAKIAASGAVSDVRVPGLDGLPAGDLRAVAESASGAILVGHEIGATALESGRKEHYHSQRWIPAQRVTAVGFADRSRWIATTAGIARISYSPTTLAEKASIYEDALEEHWRMDGFVDDSQRYRDPWDHSAGPIHTDHDNDGLWTEMQIGTWCYAYAVTKDERYYQKARRAVQVMYMQFDIPGETFAAAGMSRGFITRSLVRDDEGEIFEEKAQKSNWHLQEFRGRRYYWKDDTSSDEYAGHYFGLPIYHDLCAKDDAERKEISDRLRLSTDYVIANGYLLIDLDGKPTTFGRWKDLAVAADGIDGCPERHGDVGQCLSSWGGGGWLNSLEILGHLLATWHVTGDQKYYDEYERLYTVERYGKMIPVTDHTLTVTDPKFANHSDHELAMLAYATLLRYEPNPDRREIVIKSIRDLYEHERPEHNPWHVATVASAYGPDVDLAGAVQVLKDIPLDYRTWRVDNSHRKDAVRIVPDRHDNPQFDRVFPYDEIRTMKWNGNPYVIADGGDGRQVLAPTPYLIGYWMMRYYGLIR